MDRQLTAEERRRHEAMEEFVLPELEVMMRVAMSLTGNSADAEDLVQDTLIRAYRAIDRFDGRYPRAWLLTILRNTHLNRIRKKRPVLFREPDEALELLADESQDELSHPEQTVMDRTLDHRVARAYEELPEKFRDVVRLVDIEGLAYKEAAEVLDIKLGTVMSRLHRARNRMKRSLIEQGFLKGEPEE